MSEINLDPLRLRLYHVYGLTIQSNFEIPYLAAPQPPVFGLDPPVLVSLEVRWTEQFDPPEPGQLLLERGAGKVRITYSEVGRTTFHNNRDILFEARPDASAEHVCQVLMSLTLPIAAALNKLTPIHASAVSTPEGAVVFLGDSGAGKSTTALALAQCTRWPMLSDDVCAVSWDAQNGSSPFVHSGPAVSRLWQNTVDKLGIDASAYPMQRLSNGKLAFDLSLNWRRTNAEIRAFFYLMGENGEARPHDVKWLVRTLIDSIQVEPLLDRLGLVPELSKTLIAAVNHVGVIGIARREIGDDLAPTQIAAVIERKLGECKKGRE